MDSSVAAKPQSDAQGIDAPARGAWIALLLLLAINLFNYVDRYVFAAVELKIEEEFNFTQAQMGRAATAFLWAYMLFSPIFGRLAERMSRWLLVGVGVVLWSLASGGTGLIHTYAVLLFTRCLVGVGEAAYGPTAPTILSDLYPIKSRGKILAWFYVAIPVGSALGYVLGMIAAPYGWRTAFFVVVPPGILLGVWSFLMKDPRRLGHGAAADSGKHKPTSADYVILLKTRSYVLNTLAMAAMTFAIGGIAFWMPKYIVLRYEAQHLRPDLNRDQLLAHVNLLFGALSAGGGLFATILGGIAGDAFRTRIRGAYLFVSGCAMILSFPILLVMLHVPFPLAWVFLFITVFCLFFNTGPTNTALANVTHPAIRATAFALNIFFIHLFGDALSPWLIGVVADHAKGPGNSGLSTAFTIVSVLVLAGGALWLWAARHLDEDTELAPKRLGSAGAFPVILKTTDQKP
jgi:MFS family permease